MSTPLLVEPSPAFRFQLHRGTTNYFNEAKSEIQAAAVSSQQVFNSLSLALQAQNAGSLSNSAIPGAAAGALGTNSPAVFSSPQFTAALGLLKNLGAPSPTLNNLAALNIAAADQTTEAIFNLLGDPEKAASFAGKTVFFGVVTVTINPGFRTRKNYIADLGVMPRYVFVPARREVVKRWLQAPDLPDAVRGAILVASDMQFDLPFVGGLGWRGAYPPFDRFRRQLRKLTKSLKSQPGRHHARAMRRYRGLLARLRGQMRDWSKRIPARLMDTNNVGQPLAMAVSPLADLDVSDFGSSQRSQSDFALSLAGLLQQAGLQVQASAFDQYAKRLELDAHTRSAKAAINTYSEGGLFGWEVGPRFRAIEDPSVRRSGVPANILDRQTFPSLIIVGIRARDLSPRLELDSSKHAVTVLEPYLHFQAVSRWLRTKHHWWGRLWERRYSEGNLLQADASLGLPVSRLRALINGPQAPAYGWRARLALTRMRALSFDVFGNDIEESLSPEQIVPLPAKPPAAPTITAVVPKQVLAEADDEGDFPSCALRQQCFAILGKNFNTVDTNHITDALQTLKHIKVGSRTDDAIRLSADITKAEPIVFMVSARLTNADDTVTTSHAYAPEAVNVRLHREDGAPVAVLKTVQTAASPTNSLAEFTVRIARNTNPNDLKAALSIILNEINKAKSPNNANVSVQVQADQKK